MHEPSEEQMAIINYIIDGKNVVVDACAGSGKSTTILSAAKRMPNERFLQITYNSSLRQDVVAKASELGISNLEVHTFHSLAVKYFLPSAHTDTGLRQILNSRMLPTRPLPEYDIVVLDEAQDMSLIYYRFIRYVIGHLVNKIQILVMGDWMQGLYEFKGADTRFLTLADKIWCGFDWLQSPLFCKCTLRTSYRVTNEMAEFVNQVMLGEPRLVAQKSGGKVVYIRNSRINIERVVVFRIKQLVDGGTPPDDIFILGGSVSGPNSNIRRIENALVEANIPTHVPMNEVVDKIDERVIQGKVVFSTFHSVKGRQRKHVFVVGFDQTYFSFFARNAPTDQCPNTLYVACTRATEGLYLLEFDQYDTDRPLEFLRKSHIEMKKECGDFIEFKGHPKNIFYENSAADQDAALIPTYHTTPTKLIKFLPESVVEEISTILDQLFVVEQPKMEDIEIPGVVRTKTGFYEDVSDLNGIAIPCIYYDYMEEKWGGGGNNQNLVLYDIIQNKLDDMRPNDHAFLRNLFAEIDPTNMKGAGDYLYMANMYVSVSERLYYKMKQITKPEYSWLTDDMISRCKERMDQSIGRDCVMGLPEYEKAFIHYTMERENLLIDAELARIYGSDARFRFSARLDVLSDTTIWEIKCTSQLSTDHFIQVIIYAWLWKTVYPDIPKMFRIINIKTGEILRLVAEPEKIDDIFVQILRGKYGKMAPVTDEEFIANCLV